MITVRRVIMGFAFVLIPVWLYFNCHRMSTGQDDAIRVALAVLFAILVLRRHNGSRPELIMPAWVVPTAAASGCMLAVGGAIVGVSQLNWIGVMLIVYACLQWAMPASYSRNILVSMCFLYWAHPIPGELYEMLRLGMQRMSIHSAEILLHAANVRVWADGMLLHTSFRTLGVPEACSGMKTTLAVLLYAFGVGVLFRFKLRELTGLAVAGLLQTLAMNILRISFIAAVADRKPEGWEGTFLHDTLGILMAASICVIQIEASLLRRYIKKQQSAAMGHSQGDPRQGPLRDAIVFGKFKWVIGMVLVMVLIVCSVAIRKWPYHRAMMIDGIIENLVATSLEDAERATTEALRLVPDDYYLRTRKIQVLLLRSKFREALAELAKAPERDKAAFHAILQGRGLAGLGQTESSIAVLEALPPETRVLPGVSMVLAEFAAQKDDLPKVVENVIRAASWESLGDRISRLFPYLVAHEQSAVIVRCAPTVRLREPGDALIVVYAYLKMKDLAGAGNVLESAIEKWPGDARFTRYLERLATTRPGGRWETLFENALRTQLDALSVDDLAFYLESGFRLSRPDLGWLAYNRLAEISPGDPSLLLAPAQFADVWFTFRKHAVCVPAVNMHERVDMGSFYFKSQKWPKAPLAEELTGTDAAKARRDRLRACVHDLSRMERSGTLAPRLQMNYATALRLTGRDKDADDRLLKAQKAYAAMPERSRMLNTFRAMVEQTGGVDAAGILKAFSGGGMGDSGFIGVIEEMAATRPLSRWEDVFESGLRSNINKLNADALSLFVESSFRLSRPDLAWLAYSRLSEVNPADPALLLAPVQFGDVWFTFRNTQVGIPSASDLETVNLKALYFQRQRWPVAPLAKELSAGNAGETKARYVRSCLDTLDKMDREGRLSFRTGMTYVRVLTLVELYGDAHARLAAMGKAHPSERANILYEHALLYAKVSAWPEVYETLRQYTVMSYPPRLSVQLMQINALMHLDLGVYALAVADKAFVTFRGAPETFDAIAQIWAVFGDPEQSLFMLSHIDGYLDGMFESPVLADLFFRTERFEQARAMRNKLGMPALKIPARRRQAVLMPRAELAIAGHWGEPLSASAMAQEADRIEKRLPARESRRSLPGDAGAFGSPFVEGLTRITVEWYRSGGNGYCSDPARWSAVGRDQMEQGVALGELAGLLARQRRFEEAGRVVAQAISLVPESAILWRMKVSLSNGDRGTVEQAYRACPSDPEIWLARLVTRFRDEGAGEWSFREIESAVAQKKVSVGVMVRAGDFMRRMKMTAAAMAAARYAVADSRGFLPAYMLGIRCALAGRDTSWGLLCASYAAENAVNPWPFYKVTAEVYASAFRADSATISVLEKLVAEFPDEPEWAINLGDVYLRRWDGNRAWATLDQFADVPGEKVGLRTLILAAEAARQAGRMDRAVGILESAHRMYPANFVALNNLVYTLALDRKTLPRARELLPGLLSLSGQPSVAVLDTAAAVYRQSGEPDKSAECLRKAIGMVDSMDPWWLRMNPAAVDVAVYLGRYDYRESKSPAGSATAKKPRDELVPLARELSRKMEERAAK